MHCLLRLQWPATGTKYRIGFEISSIIGCVQQAVRIIRFWRGRGGDFILTGAYSLGYCRRPIFWTGGFFECVVRADDAGAEAVDLGLRH